MDEATPRELRAERVLRAAEAVPAGSVVSYGMIAALVGCGPRQVGQVMAHWGSGTPWWRVTNARGELPAELVADARRRWRDEGTPLRPDGRADLAAAAPDAEAWAAAWRLAVGDLPAG